MLLLCLCVLLSCQVLEWSPLPDGGVAVTTDYKTYHADKLVISSGAWMEQMVPELKVMFILSCLCVAGEAAGGVMHIVAVRVQQEVCGPVQTVR
jgi:glycine/D-amino acid oxidase-like deaminating enzyme